MTSLSSLTVTELADGICLRAGRIAAAQAELLTWIAEFDRREGWAGAGLLSCAHWLSWRIGLSPSAAREQVRVARRLADLPEIATGFAEGRVSYSKVRAVTRVAEQDDGIDWVGLARHSSAAQLERIVRGVRRAQANDAAERDPEAAAWKLRTRTRFDDNGNFCLTISGPAEYLPVVQAGIAAKRAELQRARDAACVDDEGRASTEAGPGPTSPEAASAEAPVGFAEAPRAETFDLDQQAVGWPAGTTWREVHDASAAFLQAQQVRAAAEAEPAEAPAPAPTAPAVDASTPALAADTSGASAEAPEAAAVTDAEALLALAQEALADERAAHPEIARRRRPQLTAQIDPLSGWGRVANGELLPPSSLRTVMQTLPGRRGVLRLRPVAPADLHRQDLGRTQREASTALRELLGTLDGERCRFPGCTRHSKLHAHHVVYWSDGGDTSLGNLVLVCSRHHTLIHTQGFVLTLHPDRRLDVSTADGVPILHHPVQPWGDAAALARTRSSIHADTLPPDSCDARLDLHYVVSVLLAQAA